MLLIQIIIVLLTFVVWYQSAKENKLPKGIVEWALTIISMLILISWISK